MGHMLAITDVYERDYIINLNLIEGIYRDEANRWRIHFSSWNILVSDETVHSICSILDVRCPE